MDGSISSCLPIAMKCVGEALQLDSQNQNKEAYCQYLSSIIYICQLLKDDAWERDLRFVYNNDTVKLFRLIHQCEERALSIASTCNQGSQTSGSQLSSISSVPQDLSSSSSTTDPRVHGSASQPSILPSQQPNSTTQHLPLPPQPPRKYSDSSVPSNTAQPSKTLHLPSPPGSPIMPKHHRAGSYSAIERSYKQNQKMISAYRMRTERTQAKLSGYKRSNLETASKNLSVLRRMSENQVIAKAREEALKKKIRDRQERLWREANRRFDFTAVATKEDQEKRLLYTKILEFEQEAVWPQQLRMMLKLKPDDAALINNVIEKIFRSPDHPLTQFLREYQYQVHRKLEPLVKDVTFPQSPPPTYSTSEQPCNQGGQVMDSENVEGGEVGEEQLGGVVNFEESGGNDEHKEGEFSSGEHSSEQRPKNDESSVGESLVDNKNKKEEDSKDSDSNSNSGDAPEQQPDEETPTSEEKGEGDICKDDADIVKVHSEKCEHKDKDIARADTAEAASNTNLSSLRTNTELTTLRTLMETEGTDGEEVNDTTESSSSGVIPEKDNDKSEQFKQKDASLENDETEYKLDKQTESDNTEDPIASVQDPDLEAEFQELEDEMMEWEVSDDELECGQLAEPSNEQSSHSIDVKTDTPDVRSSVDSDMQGPGAQEETSEEACLPERVGRLQDNSTSEAGQSDSTGLTCDPEELCKHLREIFVDIRFFLEKLQKLIVLAYEELDTPAGLDQCYASVEHPFFYPLWNMILAVLRRVNYDREIALAGVMTKHICGKPADMCVATRLCLGDEETLVATGNTYPYQMAVEEIQKVVTYHCPLEKLECIVRSSRAICQCVEDYWENKGKPRMCAETSIGCDDLLPILSYVIIKSGMAQLVSECTAMEEFIPEGYLMGEEGYCLTTLQTALMYLGTLEQKNETPS